MASQKMTTQAIRFREKVMVMRDRTEMFLNGLLEAKPRANPDNFRDLCQIWRDCETAVYDASNAYDDGIEQIATALKVLAEEPDPFEE